MHLNVYIYHISEISDMKLLLVYSYFNYLSILFIMNNKNIIIVSMFIVIILLWWVLSNYYATYQQLFEDYSPKIVRWNPIKYTDTIISGEQKIMNISDDILLIDSDEFQNKSFRFNITTGYVLINVDLVRNEKIIHGLWGGTISTQKHYGIRPDGTESINEDKKCLVINGQEVEGCEYINSKSYQWQEYMKFKDYKQWDKIVISLREMLSYGNSVYSRSIENIK